jgi:hypothetical protein
MTYNLPFQRKTLNGGYQSGLDRVLRWLFFATIGLLQGIGCSRAVQVPTNIAKTEYDVYRQLLEDLNSSEHFEKIYIADSTIRTYPRYEDPGTVQQAHRNIYMRTVLDSMAAGSNQFQPGQFRDFLLETSGATYRLYLDSLQLPNLFRSATTYVPNSSDTLKMDSLGGALFVKFSRPAMNPARDQCLLFVKLETSVGGRGTWYWLKLVNHSWTRMKEWTATTWMY